MKSTYITIIGAPNDGGVSQPGNASVAPTPQTNSHNTITMDTIHLFVVKKIYTLQKSGHHYTELSLGCAMTTMSEG